MFLTEFVENNKQRTYSSRYYIPRYGLDVRRNLFCSPTRKEVLISGLRATHSANQWVAGILSSGFKWEDIESVHTRHPLLKLKMNVSTDSFIDLFILFMACTGTT
jgi:hypothetical protein